ncbi:MAG: hypothetical protein NVS1B14_07000 [Vulcanimicrobiaceae bacterium]
MGPQTPSPMPDLGAQFRAAREARGLSLSDVAEHLRIRSVYLGDIEDENWAEIGAPVYIRGFLRTYARFLGLDPEEAVAQFNKSPAGVKAGEPTGMSRAPQESEARAPSPLLWVASAVAVILVGVLIYTMLAPRHLALIPSASPLPSNSAPSATPAAPQPASPAARPAGAQHNSLRVSVRSGSWVRVTVDGVVQLEGIFARGTTKEFRGKSALVRVGNAGGVDIAVNGRPVGTLGRAGDVVERTFTL